jgi:hypothetical protein
MWTFSWLANINIILQGVVTVVDGHLVMTFGLVELVHARKFSLQDTNKADLCILGSSTFFELQIFKLVDSVDYARRKRHDSNS